MTAVRDTADWATTSTAQQVQLYNGSIAAMPADLPVDAYASIMVVLFGNVGAVEYAALCTFKTAGGIYVDKTALSAHVPGGNGGAWALPVVAPYLNISESGMVGQYVAIYGSTLPVPGKRMLGDYTPGRQFGGTIPNGTPALTVTRLPGTGLDGTATFPDLSGFNGDCDFIFRVQGMGGAAQIDLMPEILNYDGSLNRIIYQSLTAVGTVRFRMAHPRAFVRWTVRNTTATTGIATMDVTVSPCSLA